MAAETAPVLEVDGVSSGYDETTVLRDVTLRIPAGQVTAVLGANGAGKTTLLRTISGLIRPTAGRIVLAGSEVTGLPPHRRAARGLCYIPEGRAVFRALSVRDNITVQALPGKETEAVERAVDAFPVLRDRMGQVAGSLSGGQQQMLALARAYVRDSALILVDEASLGLAPIIVDSIFEFLRILAARGTALVVVDQFAARVLALASSAYVLRRGTVVFGGSSAELTASRLLEEYVGRADEVPRS